MTNQHPIPNKFKRAKTIICRSKSTLRWDADVRARRFCRDCDPCLRQHRPSATDCWRGWRRWSRPPCTQLEQLSRCREISLSSGGDLYTIWTSIVQYLMCLSFSKPFLSIAQKYEIRNTQNFMKNIMDIKTWTLRWKVFNTCWGPVWINNCGWFPQYFKLSITKVPNISDGGGK